MAERILVVDDDLDTLRLVGLMLDKQGYKISAASNGRQALALAKSEHPDLILLDVMMPGMDGVEVARQLRADPDTHDIMIIMFTAKTQADDKVAGFDAGADDYLTKPTQPAELVAHVKAVLKRSRRDRETPAAKPVGEGGRVIGVMSVRGGMGVSTLAVNLGITLYTQYKKGVILADFRPGCGVIGLDLGYENAQGLSNLLSVRPSELGAREVETQLITHSSGIRLLLSSPDPKDSKYITALEHFAAITAQLSYLAPFVILDLGISLTPLIDRVLSACDLVVIVTEPVVHTLVQTRMLMKHLQAKGITNERVFPALMNRSRSGIQLSLGQVQDQLGRPVSVVFPPAQEMAYQASYQNTPLVLLQPDGIITQQFVGLAEKVFKWVK